jgi:hypothetical protein
VNKYSGTARSYGKSEHARNVTIAAVRSAILRNKTMLLGTSHTEKWHTILRTEFPDVKLKIVEDGVVINEKS